MPIYIFVWYALLYLTIVSHLINTGGNGFSCHLISLIDSGKKQFFFRARISRLNEFKKMRLNRFMYQIPMAEW